MNKNPFAKKKQKTIKNNHAKDDASTQVSFDSAIESTFETLFHMKGLDLKFGDGSGCILATIMPPDEFSDGKYQVGITFLKSTDDVEMCLDVVTRALDSKIQDVICALLSGTARLVKKDDGSIVRNVLFVTCMDEEGDTLMRYSDYKKDKSGLKVGSILQSDDKTTAIGSGALTTFWNTLTIRDKKISAISQSGLDK